MIARWSSSAGLTYCVPWLKMTWEIEMEISGPLFLMREWGWTGFSRHFTDDGVTDGFDFWCSMFLIVRCPMIVAWGEPWILVNTTVTSDGGVEDTLSLSYLILYLIYLSIYLSICTLSILPIHYLYSNHLLLNLEHWDPIRRPPWSMTIIGGHPSFPYPA